MARIISPGTSGNVEVDHFDITKDTFQGFQVEHITPGRYARLKVNGHVIMSDTDMELRTNMYAVFDAHGDVLIGGLGLGTIVIPIVLKSQVVSVTVIEINPDVISVVLPGIRDFLDNKICAQTGQYYGLKLKIERGDIHTWRPERLGRQFDFIYFDIWSDLCVNDVEERKRLHVDFRRYLRKGGRVTSWEYNELRYLKSQGRWR